MTTADLIQVGVPLAVVVLSFGMIWHSHVDTEKRRQEIEELEALIQAWRKHRDQQ